MNTCIYDKSDKGREEIATRKYQLRSKLRTLLLMIDGRHSLGGLLTNFAALGMSGEHIDELLGQGYIALIGGGPAIAQPAADAVNQARPPASARARMQARLRSQVAREAGAQERGGVEFKVEVEVEARADADVAAFAAPADAPADVERLRALSGFYNETVMSTIGLRGIALQLKVEKAASIDELRALRLAFLQAVLKAKGPDTAIELRQRLDALLGGRPEPDDFTLPDAAQPPRGIFDYFNLANDSVNF
jgi:hypothetical protein